MHILKQKRSKINILSFYFRKLEKEQIKSEVRISKEIIRIRTETNEIENRNLRDKNNETKSWFFENKINKLLAMLTKEKKREDTNYY